MTARPPVLALQRVPAAHWELHNGCAVAVSTRPWLVPCYNPDWDGSVPWMRRRAFPPLLTTWADWADWFDPLHWAVHPLRRFRNLLEIVASLHGQGIIHRDLRPANLLLAPSDTFSISCSPRSVRLAEARHPRTKAAERLPAEPWYIAPEALDAEAPSASEDVWSLGVLCFQLLHEGQHPFRQRGDTEWSYVLRHVRGEHVPEQMAGLHADLPTSLSLFLKRCLAARERRFSDAAEMLRALDRMMQDLERPQRLAFMRRFRGSPSAQDTQPPQWSVFSGLQLVGLDAHKAASRSDRYGLRGDACFICEPADRDRSSHGFRTVHEATSHRASVFYAQERRAGHERKNAGVALLVGEPSSDDGRAREVFLRSVCRPERAGPRAKMNRPVSVVGTWLRELLGGSAEHPHSTASLNPAMGSAQTIWSAAGGRDAEVHTHSKARAQSAGSDLAPQRERSARRVNTPAGPQRAASQRHHSCSRQHLWRGSSVPCRHHSYRAGTDVLIRSPGTGLHLNASAPRSVVRRP